MLRGRLALWLSVFVFPPLGLVLLWMRGNVGVLRRIAGTLGICIVAIVELIYVYGMRVEWNGMLVPMSATFESRARHDARVEESSAKQRAEGPLPEQPAATAPMPSAPTVAKPAAVQTPEKVR